MRWENLGLTLGAWISGQKNKKAASNFLWPGAPKVPRQPPHPHPHSHPLPGLIKTVFDLLILTLTLLKVQFTHPKSEGKEEKKLYLKQYATHDGGLALHSAVVVLFLLLFLFLLLIFLLLARRAHRAN